MIEGFVDPMVEPFQNAEKFDDVFEEMGEDHHETFKNATKANMKKEEEEDTDDEDITYQEEDDDKDIEAEDDDEDIEEEDDSFDMKQLAKDIKKYKNFKSSKNNKSEDAIEGFQGSRYQLYYNQNLLLKCLLFGILFYILASPKTYTYTNKFIPVNMDRIVVHTIIFTLVVFIVYQLI